MDAEKNRDIQYKIILWYKQVKPSGPEWDWVPKYDWVLGREIISISTDI